MPWCLPCVDWNAVDVIQGDEDMPRAVASLVGGHDSGDGGGDDGGGAESSLVMVGPVRPFAVAVAVAVVVVGVAVSGTAHAGDETLGVLAVVAVVAGTFVVAPIVLVAV